MLYLLHRDWGSLFYESNNIAKPHLQIAILRTCRQAYDEGIYIMYTKNVFATIVRDYTHHFHSLFP
jgi:hypothetical protein